MNDNILYDLWLITSLDVASPKIHNVLDAFGSSYNAFNAKESALKEAQGLREQEIETLIKYKDLERAKKVLDLCEKDNISIITYNDEGFPDNLKNIANPPILLFTKGNKLQNTGQLNIAIIGTRIITNYGARVAEHIAYDLASAGAVVISGLAKGIDGYAHRGALKADGKTIAVLGCGVDVIYPYENKNLYEEILEKGTIISEFLPGTKPYPHNFQARNRILSGISEGVVIVESPKKGGSLITVKWALEQGRDVFAVPGPVDSFQSEGTNDLIKQGAKLTGSAYDILEEYVFTYPHKINLSKLAGKMFSREPGEMLDAANEKVEYKNKDIEVEPISEGILNEKEQKIYDILSKKPIELTQIVDETEIAINDTVLALLSMQIGGFVKELPGGFYVKI